MKIISILVLFILSVGHLFGQDHPLVTAHDINFIPDSITTWAPSPMAGDTVRVQGVVMFTPIVNRDTDRRVIMGNIQANAAAFYIQAEDRSPWSSIFVYQTDTAISGTLWAIVDTASIYEFTGVVTTYGDLTEFILVTSPQPIQLTFQGTTATGNRPDPIPLNIDSCFASPDPSNTLYNLKLRKYLGMYVQVSSDATHSIRTSNLVGGSGTTSGSFFIDNGNGRTIEVFAQSKYFKTTTANLQTNYVAPSNGSYLSYVKGILGEYGGVYEIIPIYPSDLGPKLKGPPLITNCKRDPGVVTSNTPVTVTATVVGNMGAGVKSVQLFTTTNGVLDSLNMTKGTGADSTKYLCVIPGIASDSAFVGYYVKAIGSDSLASTSPNNITTSQFSYFVLNASNPLTIQHVRYSPFGSGYSSYYGYKVKISGVVIADTSDIPGNHGTNPPRVYIQNGSTPWSGIKLGVVGTIGSQITGLVRGDNVTVEGTITLNAYGTVIDTLDLLTINSHGNPLPAPQVMKTADVGTFLLGKLSAEPWNGCLVTYQDVTIDSANADGTSNFGESYGQDAAAGTHTRLIWSDGNTFLNAGASAVNVHKGDHFSSITGVLGYTHAYYKLCPRKDNDIVGFTDIKSDKNVIPTAYKLNQNFPNPFNPSTIISYDLPKSGIVSIKIFNVLGQLVRTLVNQSQVAGTHQVTFNANSLNSGIYFYSLTVDNFTQVKKMILIK